MTARPETHHRHRPVLLKEVLDALAPRDGAIYVDGTFGAGGYSTALLAAADCQVWGIDRDAGAAARGRELAESFGGRLHIIEGRFGDMGALLADKSGAVDGVALDLGVSSMQLDEAERGFSFRADGPLDMRMEGPQKAQGAEGRPTAADVVNSLPEAELADVIYDYGEERRARQVARAIVAARAEQPITRTGQLADIVRGVVKPARPAKGQKAIDPATRTFQALRIYVNDELGELRRGLEAAEALLGPGGRLAVVSFHSLEDRIVKQFLRERCGQEAGGSRHAPPSAADARPAATFTLLFRGTQRPQDSESRDNPRARSAQLRAAERTGAPAWREVA